jgi:hypothetical protein
MPQEDAMNPWKVSAQFAAFVWYSNRKTEEKATAAEAAQFAKENWIAFLPYAHEGYGRLLIRIARPGSTRGVRSRPGNCSDQSKLSGSTPALAR